MSSGQSPEDERRIDFLKSFKDKDPGMDTREFTQRIGVILNDYVDRADKAQEKFRETNDPKDSETYLLCAKDLYVFGKLLTSSLELAKENKILQDLVDAMVEELDNSVPIVRQDPKNTGLN